MDIGSIIGVLYGMVVVMIGIMGLFIAYHIIKYSFSKAEMTLTLGLFLSVLAVLMVTNLVIFSNMDFSELFSLIG